MRVTITIDTDGQAFDFTPMGELARILRQIAQDVTEDGPQDIPVRDVNGNTVGRIEWGN